MHSNTIPISVSEMRKLVGLRRFLNPFTSLKNSVRRVLGDKTDAFTKRAIWSADKYESLYENQAISATLLSQTFIGMVSGFIITKEFIGGLLVGLLISVGLFLATIICLLISYMLQKHSSTQLTKHIILDTQVRETQYSSLNVLLAKDVFIAEEELRVAGFSDSDIGKLDSLINDLVTAENYRKKLAKISTLPAVNSGSFSEISPIHTDFHLHPEAQELLERTMKVISNTHETCLISDSNTELGSTIGALLYAGVDIEKHHLIFQ